MIMFTSCTRLPHLHTLYSAAKSICLKKITFSTKIKKVAESSIYIPWLERIIPDDTLRLFRHMLPGGGVGEVHQGFGVEEAEAEAAVDHQPGSVPLPARVVGQRVEL